MRCGVAVSGVASAAAAGAAPGIAVDALAFAEDAESDATTDLIVSDGCAPPAGAASRPVVHAAASARTTTRSHAQRRGMRGEPNGILGLDIGYRNRSRLRAHAPGAELVGRWMPLGRDGLTRVNANDANARESTRMFCFHSRPFAFIALHSRCSVRSSFFRVTTRREKEAPARHRGRARASGPKKQTEPDRDERRKE